MSTEVKPNDLNLSSKISSEAKEDIVELHNKIADYRAGKIDDEKFRGYRLARGVYGQRQEGVQMIRIKIPFGKISPDQIIKIADISDKYAHHNLHLTTRQDIQIHYVKLENAPKVWAELEEVNVTTREACGNTVRNITGSAAAGVDPNEPFDVSPYVYEHFRYFLRNPICQEMGRKFKASFSCSEEDTAFGFMHDIGYIPKVRVVDGREERGFKTYVGGGLGAQPFMAFVTHEFLPEDQTIPYMEAVIRVFDRFGERTKRNKARLKYLIAQIGIDEFNRLVEEQRLSLKTKSYIVDRNILPESVPSSEPYHIVEPSDKKKFDAFVKTNVFEQKQKGYYGVYIRVFLGDMATDTAREFANVIKKYASDDVRITVNQGYLLKFVQKEALPALFNDLDKIGLGEPGFDSTADITACPGTDTCNLGISSSTGISGELEKMFKVEYPDLIFNKNIKIKISGCMNACGQHTIANIGFHGMSIKNGAYVLPAMQLLLGGGLEPDGSGSIADKVIKLPTKRCLDAVRLLLNDYEENSHDGEYFNNYYRRQIATDKMYYYKMLKPLSDLSTINDFDYIDWGHTEKYVTEVGVGECAGVVLDLVAIIINDTEEKLKRAIRNFEKGAYADSIYSSYVTFISGAKALLMTENINCNTQNGIINDFNEHFVKKGLFTIEGGDFAELVLKLNTVEPTKEFATGYLAQAKSFVASVVELRKKQTVS